MSEKLSKLGENFKQEWTKTVFITPTFCVIPWVHLPIGPHEYNTKLCCYSLGDSLTTESGQPYSFTKHTLDEIWNGKSMREIRKKMLAGEKLKECQRCYNYESIRKLSGRIEYNLNWISDSSPYRKFILNKVKKSMENNYKVSPANFFEISFGNFCNLQCRMCSPESSSKIQKEAEELIEENKENSQYFNGRFLENAKFSQNWYKNPRFLENVYRWIPYIKKISLTGGEPTLIKEVWELIEYIKDNGYSKNIALHMNINCTHVPEKLLDAFNHFQKVDLYLSIDGYKKVQEYIRYPSKWEIVENNVKKILKQKNEKTYVVLIPTLQIYNIFNITELFQWAENFFDKMNIYYNHFNLNRKILDFDILPKSIKQICLDKILNYKNHILITKLEKINMSFYIGLESLKNLLSKPSPPDSKYHLAEFRKYTEMLDKKRGNSFQKTFPELYELLEEDGSWR